MHGGQGSLHCSVLLCAVVCMQFRADTVADIVADTVADTVPNTVADTVADTVAETMSDSVAHNVAFAKRTNACECGRVSQCGLCAGEFPCRPVE